MKKVIDVLRWICAIVLALGIIIFGFVSIISSTILSKGYVLEKLSETDYYINTYSQVNIDFENYIYQSGLNSAVVENLVTVENIKEDTAIIIENIYDGQSEPIDLEKVKDRLRTNIEKNIKEKNIWVKSQESIEKYVEVVSEQYQDSILHTDIEDDIFKGIESINKLISKLTTISISMIGVSAIIIIVSRYKKFWQNFTMLGVSLVTAGAFYVFAKIFIVTNIDIDHIIILSEAISYTIKTIIYNVLNKIDIAGIIMLILGIVLIIVGSAIRSSKHAYSKRMH